MNGFLKSIDKVDRVLEIFLITLMIVLVLDVTWQVVTRFILPEPSSYTEEIARFLLIWISLLGSAFAYRKGMHLGIDFFVGKFGESARVNCQLVVLLSCVIFAVVIFIIGGANRVMIAFQLNQVAASLGIKMGYVFLVTPITGALFLLYTFEYFVKSRIQHEPSTLDSHSN